MGHQPLVLCCTCGHGPALIQGVGLTASHQLRITWHCAACGKEVFLLKPLSDCWRECPSADSLEEGEAAASQRPADWNCDDWDAEFLKSLGIAAAPGD
jgi:hypothetical protein